MLWHGETSNHTSRYHFNFLLSTFSSTAPSNWNDIKGLYETFNSFLLILFYFFRESFRMWFSPSCVTQTVMMNCGRRTHTSTFAWSLVSKEDGCFNRRSICLPPMTNLLDFAVSFRCVWGLHLSNNCSSDSPLHLLQQKERGKMKCFVFLQSLMTSECS